MKIAQPASLPPGERSSAGISRSTAVSTRVACSGLKNFQPAGCTGSGAPGGGSDESSGPAQAESAAAEASKARRVRRDIIASPSSAVQRTRYPARLIASGPEAWQVGMISIRLMLTCAGRPTAQATASAMSSALSGVVPA